MIKYIEALKNIDLPTEEAYRTLMSNIQFCGFKKEIKSLAVLSYNQNEGKTTTSVMLSILMAKTGLKVLLIDGDLRKITGSRVLEIRESAGLTALLAGRLSFRGAFCPASLANLWYIPCGPKSPNPGELIACSVFREMLVEAKESFDITIIDTPPLAGFIDGAVMASRTNASVLVIKPETLSREHAVLLKDQLKKANANVLGVILNGMKKNEYKKIYGRYYSHEN